MVSPEKLVVKIIDQTSDLIAEGEFDLFVEKAV